jgi:hypothetical protein
MCPNFNLGIQKTIAKVEDRKIHHLQNTICRVQVRNQKPISKVQIVKPSQNTKNLKANAKSMKL